MALFDSLQSGINKRRSFLHSALFIFVVLINVYSIASVHMYIHSHLRTRQQYLKKEDTRTHSQTNNKMRYLEYFFRANLKPGIAILQKLYAQKYIFLFHLLVQNIIY